jgi:hypothetical protein
MKEAIFEYPKDRQLLEFHRGLNEEGNLLKKKIIVVIPNFIACICDGRYEVLQLETPAL